MSVSRMPKILKIRRQGNNPLHPQGTPRVGLLEGGELVVEEQKEG
jgi:hypothetical protein